MGLRNPKQNKAMKIYYFYNDSFFKMKQNFEDSFKDDFDRQVYKLDKNTNNKAGGGGNVWDFKTNMIVNAIQENDGEIILVSDIDIIFYQPVVDKIQELMKQKDILFQSEWLDRFVNIGFIAIRCCQKTLRFWEIVRNQIFLYKSWDQRVVNELLYDFTFNMENRFEMRWGRLPISFWARSLSGSKLNVPNDIYLHHANGVSSMDGKFEQFDLVKNKLNEK